MIKRKHSTVFKLSSPLPLLGDHLPAHPSGGRRAELLHGLRAAGEGWCGAGGDCLLSCVDCMR